MVLNARTQLGEVEVVDVVGNWITQCGLPTFTNVYAVAGGGPSPGAWSSPASDARPASMVTDVPSTAPLTTPLTVSIVTVVRLSRRHRYDTAIRLPLPENSACPPSGL